MVQSGGFAVSSSTRGALIPALVDAVLVPAANTLSYTASNVGSIIGPRAQDDEVSVVYRQTILQTYAPDAMRGRLQGVFTVVVAGGPRLGDLRSGAMASATGLTAAWTGTALACIPVALLIGVDVRPFWRYRAGPPDREFSSTSDVDKDVTDLDSDIEVT